MSFRIATRSSAGLRAQAAGGQTVLDVYQTIDHYLRQSMSAAHGNLFAEPNTRGLGGDVDWYTPVESGAEATLLTRIAPTERGLLVARLSSLLKDIRARAAELKSSPKQSDRLLGQLLQLATEVPAEDCVYGVGDQPVLIFWGHLRDVPAPERDVLDRMIARLAPPATASAGASVGITSPAGVDSPLQPAAPIASSVPLETTTLRLASGRTRYPWLAPTLWGIFAVLCLAIALELLRGCGLGWPFVGSSSLWINYCPMPSNPNTAELADLAAQNAQLQTQLDRLLGNVAGRRQQCAIPSRPNLPPANKVLPPASAQPQDDLVIPKGCEGNACLVALAGCHGSDDMQYKMGEPQDPKYQAYPAKVTFCFGNPNRPGDGMFSLKTKQEPTIICKGPVTASATNPGHISVFQPPIESCTDAQGLPMTLDDIKLRLPEYQFECSTDATGLTDCEGNNKPPTRMKLQRKDGPAAP